MPRPKIKTSKIIIFTIGGNKVEYALDSKGNLVDKSLIQRSKKAKEKKKLTPVQPQTIDDEIFPDSQDDMSGDIFLEWDYQNDASGF